MVLTGREEKAARMRKFVSFAAGMAELLFGLDIGVISGALPFITSSFALTSQQQEWVVSAMMLGIICVPAIALLLAVFGLPDSPRWLASKGCFEDASQRVLTMLNGNDEKADAQMHDIKESLEVKQEGWALFRANKNVRRAVFLGMLLQAMQQFTGMNIIMYYAPKILSLAGFTSTTDQMLATVFDGLMFVLATFIAMNMVDKAGRKPALKIGFSVMAFGTFVLGACLYLIDQGSAAPWISYLAVAMTIVCIAGYAMSAAPVVWILCSEIQPLKSRDFGTACSTTTNWVSNMIIGASFLTLLNAIGPAMTFWLYTIMNIIFIFFTI